MALLGCQAGQVSAVVFNFGLRSYDREVQISRLKIFVMPVTSAKSFRPPAYE